jgi:NAD(P)-dependent dehydrogenase (short-subunit alcohol dehydrogenase family)
VTQSANKQRALVTGANRGIGREISEQLAQRGFHVVVGVRDSKAGQETVEAIRRVGGSADVLVLDVSDSTIVHSAAQEFCDRYDWLDVLVNNAGVFQDKGFSILTVPRERTFQINTFGPIDVVQKFLPALRKADGARIINISSGYGQLDGLSSEASGYCLSKLSLNGVTIILAAALKAEGISVNSVCPGWVRTDMGGAEAPRSVEQGADTAVWLATDADHGLTGRFFRDRKEIPW